MELQEAIKLLQKAVKYAGNVDAKHIDLTVIPAEERERYQKALAVSQMCILEGKITRDEFMRKVHLDG